MPGLHQQFEALTRKTEQKKMENFWTQSWKLIFDSIRLISTAPNATIFDYSKNEHQRSHPYLFPL